MTERDDVPEGNVDGELPAGGAQPPAPSANVKGLANGVVIGITAFCPWEVVSDLRDAACARGLIAVLESPSANDFILAIAVYALATVTEGTSPKLSPLSSNGLHSSTVPSSRRWRGAVRRRCDSEGTG